MIKNVLMTNIDFLCLSPLIILAVAPVILLLVITVFRSFRFTYYFTLVMLVAAFLSLFLIQPSADHLFGNLLILDNFGILFLGIIYAAAFLITILSYEYLRVQAGEREEYFIILLAAVFGSSVVVMSEHFITFFLGLETLSISLYVLISYLKWRNYSIEAGVKFLVIASLSTSFLLFGMGLIYTGTGTMAFREIFEASGNFSPVMLAGFGLILAGIGFKLALVPFHMWTPDVYQGSPVPITTFIASISKGAMIALALRFFYEIRGFESNALITIISVISIASMFTGNLLALMQRSVKRILAYSSIAHLGYMMIALLAGTTGGIQAAIFYTAAYIITIIGAFGVISALSVCERDADNITDFRGLFWNNPWLAIVFTLSLISLAGLPLTAGFISKFYLVLEGARAGLWLLAASLAVNSAISIYYYLRIVKEMFSDTTSKAFSVPGGINAVLALVFAGILLLGILPSVLLGIINSIL